MCLRSFFITGLLLLCVVLLPTAAAQAPSHQDDNTIATPDENGSSAAKPVADLVAREVEQSTRDDIAIASRVAAKLARHSSLANVATAVNGGTVILSGKVVEESSRDLAEALAVSVDGVMAVDNQLEISASLRDRFDSSWQQIRNKLIRLLFAAPLLLAAALLVLVFTWLGGWMAKSLHLLRWGSANPYLHSLLQRGVRLSMVLLGLLIALDLLEATALVGAVLGSAGVLGIMLGFAFKDVAENHLAGVLLSLRRPFEPGDHVVIDGHEGKVVSLNSRATILMTLDGNHLRLPNAMVFKGVLLNYTRNPMRRLHFTLGIGTGEDINAARQLGVDTMRSLSAIASDPDPQATIQSVGESSVLVDFYAWLDQRKVDFNKTRSEAIRQVKLALEEAGMDMPEPIYRVHLTRTTPTTKTRARKEEPSAAGRPSVEPEEPAVDVSVDRDVDLQIAKERATLQSEDLLQHPAEKE